MLFAVSGFGSELRINHGAESNLGHHLMGQDWIPGSRQETKTDKIAGKRQQNISSPWEGRVDWRYRNLW